MDKFLQSLGLAMRAGKIVHGEDQVLNAIKGQELSLVMVASDIGANTLKKITDKCKTYNIEILNVHYNSVELGHSVGKMFRVVIGISDEGFKNILLKNYTK